MPQKKVKVKFNFCLNFSLKQLQEVYEKDIDNIDVYIGGMLETTLEGNPGNIFFRPQTSTKQKAPTHYAPDDSNRQKYFF